MKAELNNLLTECTQQLNEIAEKMSTLDAFDKTRNYLTQYALIKTCGTVEYVYRSIVADLFDQSSLTQIQTYLNNTVRSGSMSGTYDNMSGLLSKFDVTWQSDFRNAIHARSDSQKIIASAKSLVNNRHSFAHGKPTTVSFNDIVDYYNDALILINVLDSVVK